MELWSETAWYVQALFNVLVAILPTLAGTGVIAFAARKAWKQIRPAVDEPTDPFILWVANKTGRKPETVSEFLLTNGDLIVSALPEFAPINPATLPAPESK